MRDRRSPLVGRCGSRRGGKQLGRAGGGEQLGSGQGAGSAVGAVLSVALAVGAVNFGAPSVSFLWHNVVGAVTVVVVGLALSAAGWRQPVRV